MAYVGYSIIHVNSRHNSLKDAIEYVTERKNDFKKASTYTSPELNKIIEPEDEEQVYIYSDACSFITAEEEMLPNTKGGTLAALCFGIIRPYLSSHAQ